MVLYTGNIFGFNYTIDLDSDEEFRVWLKDKLQRYILKDSNVNQVVKELLGLDEIKERLDALETP